MEGSSHRFQNNGVLCIRHIYANADNVNSVGKMTKRNKHRLLIVVFSTNSTMKFASGYMYLMGVYTISLYVGYFVTCSI